MGEWLRCIENRVYDEFGSCASKLGRKGARTGWRTGVGGYISGYVRQ